MCTEKTYLARAPGHGRVTSVPSCPYCTPGGTHVPRWVLALHTTPQQAWGGQLGSPWGYIPHTVGTALAMGSGFMQVPPQGKDYSHLGLGNEQKHRLAITVGCRAVFHIALEGLFLSGGNGVPTGSSWDMGRGAV